MHTQNSINGYNETNKKNPKEDQYAHFEIPSIFIIFFFFHILTCECHFGS